MGRVTGETAYPDIKALLERGDFATAEKLMRKFYGDLTEDQRRELENLRRSTGRRRSLARGWEALRRRWRGSRVLRGRGLWLALAGGAAYIVFFLVWLGWLPPLVSQRPERFFQGAGYCLLIYLYFFFPVFLHDTKRYLEELYRWAEAEPELAEVLEIRLENRTGQSARTSEVYHYQVSYAVVRLLKPRRGEAETMRFSLYETGDGRGLLRRGEETLTPWSFHPGDVVPLYRDRRGCLSLVHHTWRSLTREWLRRLGSRGGWLALFILAVVLRALAR